MLVNYENRYLVDPVAFMAALIGAPLLVTLIGSPLIVPLASLPLGLPVYLAMGTPALLWMVGRYQPGFKTYALAGLAGQVALMLTLILAALAFPERLPTALPIFAVFGCVFAPLWAGTFGRLYRRFYRANRADLSL